MWEMVTFFDKMFTLSFCGVLLVLIKIFYLNIKIYEIYFIFVNILRRPSYFLKKFDICGFWIRINSVKNLHLVSIVFFRIKVVEGEPLITMWLLSSENHYPIFRTWKIHIGWKKWSNRPNVGEKGQCGPSTLTPKMPRLKVFVSFVHFKLVVTFNKNIR